jgi:hypothetical protein
MTYNITINVCELQNSRGVVVEEVEVPSFKKT